MKSSPGILNNQKSNPMSKKLCKSDHIKKGSKDTHFTCKKCGLSAKKEEHLCKPEKE